MEINERTFTQVVDQLKLLGYDGHVALSCDDTKLLPGYRLYWDGQDQTHYLVGGIDGPLRVADVDQVREVLDEVGDSKKATKVRTRPLSRPGIFRN